MVLLKFDTQIKGDATVSDHKDWITCDAVQFGVGRSISASGGGKSRDTSNPSFSEVTISKSTDVASSDVFMQAICGKSLGKAELHWLQTSGEGGDQVFLKVTLHEPIVSSYSVSSGGDRPSESFSLNFTKITYHYDDFSGDRVVTGRDQNWDLMANKKF